MASTSCLNPRACRLSDSKSSSDQEIKRSSYLAIKVAFFTAAHSVACASQSPTSAPMPRPAPGNLFRAVGSQDSFHAFHHASGSRSLAANLVARASASVSTSIRGAARLVPRSAASCRIAIISACRLRPLSRESSVRRVRNSSGMRSGYGVG